ncbi:transposase [Streptomyces gardneri]|uniref:transposase n=1 Tax=Streptomyces gardneri TaxID=66892 RepID=UPI0015843179
MPKSWTEDRERCRAAKVPDDRELATNDEPSRRMVLRAVTSPMPITWVTADAAYGQESRFRRLLQSGLRLRAARAQAPVHRRLFPRRRPVRAGSNQDPDRALPSQLLVDRFSAVSAGRRPHEACATRRRRTCCSPKRCNQAASQRPASRIRAALVMLPGIRCR